MFEVRIKSGTSGWKSYDDSDKVIAVIESNNIPREGEILEIIDPAINGIKKYLVKEIERAYRLKSERCDFREYISVYVVNYY